MLFVLYSRTTAAATRVMALKRLIFAALVFAATSAAQSSRTSNGAATFDLLGVRVTLYCTSDGNTVGPNSPPFGGADVSFECGGNNIIVRGRTDDFGYSYSFANPQSVMPFIPIQSNCSIVVNTTLSTCNSAFPSAGGLWSAVKFVGTSRVGNLVVADFAPAGFHYSSTI